MCCGTHVSNLSQLQMIKILSVEKGKRKNTSLLYFVVGDRVLKEFSNCLSMQQTLTSILK